MEPDDSETIISFIQEKCTNPINLIKMAADKYGSNYYPSETYQTTMKG